MALKQTEFSPPVSQTVAQDHASAGFCIRRGRSIATDSGDDSQRGIADLVGIGNLCKIIVQVNVAGTQFQIRMPEVLPEPKFVNAVPGRCGDIADPLKISNQSTAGITTGDVLQVQPKPATVPEPEILGSQTESGIHQGVVHRALGKSAAQIADGFGGDIQAEAGSGGDEMMRCGQAAGRCNCCDEQSASSQIQAWP